MLLQSSAPATANRGDGEIWGRGQGVDVTHHRLFAAVTRVIPAAGCTDSTAQQKKEKGRGKSDISGVSRKRP